MELIAKTNKRALVSHTFVFVSVREFSCYIYSDDIKTKETTMELQQITKHTYRNTTYSKAQL